ncbi:MAG: hypothetical protein AAF598_10660 [Bacteroidota bacterium]
MSLKYTILLLFFLLGGMLLLVIGCSSKEPVEHIMAPRYLDVELDTAFWKFNKRGKLMPPYPVTAEIYSVTYGRKFREYQKIRSTHDSIIINWDARGLEGLDEDKHFKTLKKTVDSLEAYFESFRGYEQEILLPEESWVSLGANPNRSLQLELNPLSVKTAEMTVDEVQMLFTVLNQEELQSNFGDVLEYCFRPSDVIVFRELSTQTVRAMIYGNSMYRCNNIQVVPEFPYTISFTSTDIIHLYLLSKRWAYKQLIEEQLQ